MKIIACADLHLGHSRYSRTTKTGQNQRQADVERAFCRMIDAVIARQPDMVLVAGDLFDVSRPNNRTIAVAMQECSRLITALPNCCIIVVAGNHDTPRAEDNGHVFGVLGTLRMHVIGGGIARVNHEGVSVACVPDTPAAQREILEMKAKGLTIGGLVDEQASKNVLLMHGEVEGMLPKAAYQPATAHRSEIERPLDEIAPDAWNYVALGHWHVYREMAPRTFYAGSLEYTSTDPWTEMRQERKLGLAGKGFVEHDLETGAHTFHDLTCDRRHIELPTFSAEGMTSADVNAAIAQRIEEVDGGIEGQIVRLVMTDAPRDLVRDLDKKALKKYGLRALNFNLDARRPDPKAIVRVRSGNSQGRAVSLPLRIAESIRDRVLPADVEREDLLTLASKYLEETKMDGDVEASLSDLLKGIVTPLIEAQSQDVAA